MKNPNFNKVLCEAMDELCEQMRRRAEDKELLDFTLELIAEICDAPCNWSIDGNGLDEYMLEHCGEWCDKNCGQISDAECWRKYIETRFKEDTK